MKSGCARFRRRLKPIAQHLHAGGAAIEARSAVVDSLVQAAWEEVQRSESGLAGGVALVAVGGYGRRELFPYSDVDLMFLLDARLPEKTVKEPIRQVNQLLWDAGLRVSAMTRTLTECERFDPENVEFTLSLLDARAVAGDHSVVGAAAPKVAAEAGGARLQEDCGASAGGNPKPSRTLWRHALSS